MMPMATRACLLDLNMWQEFYEYCDFFRDGAKLLTVLNEDLDEEDLQTVLLECLKDAPGGYGPRGAGFIAHVDIPDAVLAAHARLAQFLGELSAARAVHAQ